MWSAAIEQSLSKHSRRRPGARASSVAKVLTGRAVPQISPAVRPGEQLTLHQGLCPKLLSHASIVCSRDHPDLRREGRVREELKLLRVHFESVLSLAGAPRRGGPGERV